MAGTTSDLTTSSGAAAMVAPLVDGLRVAALTSGGTATLSATTGDIRIGMATVAMPQGGVTSTGGNVDVRAVLGAVTGLASPDTPAGPGADLTATAGLVKVVAGTRAALDAVNASGLIDVAGAQISVGTAMAGTSLMLAAANALSLDSGMAGTTSDLTTSSGAALPPAQLTSTTATLDTGFGAANLTAGTALTTGNNVSVRADLIAQLGTVFAANAIDVTARALTVNRATATKDALRLTASHGGLYLGTGVAGTTATLIKTDIDSDGLTLAEANKDELRVTTALLPDTTSLTAGTGVVINSATSARLNSVTSTVGSIAVTSTQATTGVAGASAGASDPDFGRATLIANGMGRDVTVTTGTLAQLGSVSAGRNVSVTAGNATSMLNGAIDVSSATATAGSLLLSARAVSPVTGSILDGDIILGTGAAGTTATLSNVDRGGTAGDVLVTTFTPAAGDLLTAGGDIMINAATNARLSRITSTGGSISITATQATTGVAGASTGTSDPDFGRATLIANGMDRDVTVTTGTLAQLGSVSAGRNVSVTAGNATSMLNGAIDVSSATATAGSLLLSARAVSPVTGSILDGDIILGTGAAGTTATLSNVDRGGMNGSITVSTSVIAGGNVFVDAVSNAALGTVRSTGANIAVTSQTIGLRNLVETAASAGTITLTNRAGGSAKTIIGSDVGSDPTTNFALTAAEFNFLRSTSLTVESGAQAVEIGTLPLLASNGSTSLRLLTTNSVLLTGLISDAGNAQARTIQIGGTLAMPANPVSSSGADLATQILGISTQTGGGRINLSAANLDLRAARIVFGLQALADATLPLTPERVSVDFVAQTNSLLYNSNLLRNSSGFQSTSGEVFQTLIRANVLTVRYRDFALFQNTGSVGRAGGVVLGVDDQSLPTATTSLALQLFGTGDITTPNSNAFGLFGRVNGFIDRTAGILPSAVLDFADGTGTSRVVRITQSNSRVNGCAIGSPDKGCLVTEAPPPVVKLFDERQSQLFGVADDLDVPFDPLVGSNNEALIGDIGTGDFALLDVVCTSANTENCSSNGAPQ